MGVHHLDCDMPLIDDLLRPRLSQARHEEGVMTPMSLWLHACGFHESESSYCEEAEPGDGWNALCSQTLQVA
eukprot:CAMPEP_0115567030 /NCGR_PEP_ID=MMETSP0271-20121206/103890_1 /TAXON_ID=71861 /ORGANISM="Scrippsiella trochoidea, Strain CCMP3099" /LENGTH=71 /DNA_ID=CAMNT_0003001357 /DNA_START=347 /DNA_END=558 /DNA_ORIENTATION=+